MSRERNAWRVEKNRVVEKPWGREEIFAGEEGLYVGKVITLLDGCSVSLQSHEQKTETITVLSGELQVEVGDSAASLEHFSLSSGRSLLVPARTVHRFTATGDSVFVEVSTADPGWETDVTRLQDSFGRTGTSAQ